MELNLKAVSKHKNLIIIFSDSSSVLISREKNQKTHALEQDTYHKQD